MACYAIIVAFNTKVLVTYHLNDIIFQAITPKLFSEIYFYMKEYDMKYFIKYVVDNNYVNISFFYR